MPVFARVFSVILRVLELVSATIVVGIVGDALHDADMAHSRPSSRFIYTEVVAALSMLLSLLLLIPFTAGFDLWPLDFVFFILWIVAFSLLADWIIPMNCNWTWGNGYLENDAATQCSLWKAALAFAFISAVLWLLSSLVGMWFMWRTRGTTTHRRRRWYRSDYY